MGQKWHPEAPLPYNPSATTKTADHLLQEQPSVPSSPTVQRLGTSVTRQKVKKPCVGSFSFSLHTGADTPHTVYSRGQTILQDQDNPGHRLFNMAPSRKRYRTTSTCIVINSSILLSVDSSLEYWFSFLRNRNAGLCVCVTRLKSVREPTHVHAHMRTVNIQREQQRGSRSVSMAATELLVFLLH